VRFVFVFLFLINLLYAAEQTKNELVEVKDSSGLSDDALRSIANKQEESEELVKNWESLSPRADKFDWVQTKSGEWFKGKIKALYDEALEFDSVELGLYTFDFDDITQIKSYTIVSINIENLASFSGLLRLKGDKLKLIQGDSEYEFERKDLVSFAPSGELERNYWSGKLTLSFDIRSGNINQLDYSAKSNFQRRTAASRLTLDYLGRISFKDKEQIANDHRINEKYDIYLSRHFFWTPLFTEYYTDRYKNIDHQITAGIGMGYTLIDTNLIEWSLSGGPAVLYTKYYTVANTRSIDNLSPAMEFSTHYTFDFNKITDVTYDYRLTYTDKNAGRYRHHMVLTLENELTSWIDLDLTGVWDYILEPEENEDTSYPQKSDFQVLIGLGIEF